MKTNIQAKGILYERSSVIASLVKQKIILLIFAVIILVCGIHGISYAQLPSFSDSTASRSVAENSPTGTNIGNPVTANNFSNGTDRYRLAGTDDNADSPDSDSFGIGSATGQLTTNTELDFETKKTYQVVIIVERSQGGTWVEAANGSRITVTISVTNVFDVPLSERTEQVVDEIVVQSPVSTADAVTEAHLSKIKWLLINNEGISSLKEKDFDGLSSLSALWLYSNDLTSLPDNVFSGLTKLTQLLLQYNQLSSLPENIFSDLSKLTTLRLTGNQLSSLPDNVFSGLTKLTTLNLGGNTVDPLPLTISLVKVAEGEFKAVVPSGAPFKMVLPLSVANGIVNGGTTAFTVLAGDVKSNNSLSVTRIPGTTHAVTVDFGTPLPSLPSGHAGYALTRSDLPLTVIAALNSPPEFKADVNATPTIAENTAADTNIGTPLTAIDVDDDPVTYTLKAHTDDADDYLAFSIDSMGQLKTKDPLDHETQSVYKVTVETSDDKDATNVIDVTITLLDVYEYEPMRNRTQQVVDGILFHAPVSTADAVTEDHLEAIPYLILNNKSISSLKEKDFDGLWALTAIWLNRNDLTSLPDNIFSGLSKLDTILLSYNPLGSLDADVFSGLSKLKTLRMEGIQLRNLPPNIFSGLSKLEEIHLNDNQLSSFPDGLFSGLTKLKGLYTNGNAVSPLPLTISLVKAAESQFKAVAPAGAPFTMVLHLTTANGSIDGGVTSVRIPKGSLESDTLTVTRTPYTAAAVTVNIRNPLPTLPASHQGYAITKSTELPLTVIAEIPNNTPVFNTGLNTTPEIAENTTAGINIGTPLTATDADATDTLTYSLKAHTDDADDYLSFTIDENTGQLKTKSPLDYETQSTYKVTVAVSDNVVITTIDVTIAITDVNEAPTFPTSETGTRSIPDDVAVNVNIGAAVSATDPDTADGDTDVNPEDATVNALAYGFRGTDATSFAIDTATGQLKTKTGVTFDAAIKDTYNVTVFVTDGALSASTNVTITVVDATQFNYAPIFNTGLNTTPEIAENTTADTNIGTPLTATDADTTDTLIYSLKAHADDADDYLAFAIDNMGQLKTKANLDFETQSIYKVTVEVSDGIATATIDITITVTNVYEYTFLSDRTQQVVDEIVYQSPVSTADAVTEAHLEAIPWLLINNEGISSLKEKDFDGLSSLSAIWLYSNDLTSLPDNVFSGLSKLTQLLLQYNRLTSLPDNIFSDLSKLTTLRLTGNRLSSLPDNVFSGLTKLTTLNLSGNTVDPLPLTISLMKVAEGEFKAVVPSGAPFKMVLPLSVANGIVDGGATTLTVLAGDVESNNSLSVTRIPGTTHAVTVDFGTPLPSLPSGHAGYALTRSGLPLTVIAALNSPPAFNTDVNATPTIAENTAADTNIGTPLTAIDVDDDAVTYRLKAHADDADDYLAFAIDNMGQLKTKDPLNHEMQHKYKITVEASDVNGAASDLDVTITVLDVYEYTLLSDRTQQVVDEILFRVPVSTADAVTEDHLEAVPYLILNNESISSLKEKDFEGMWALTAIWLNNNDLTSLPDNIFSGLSKLDTILLSYNPLGSLDADVFSGLSKLKTLRMEGIQLRSLPPDIFSGLSKLEEIHINYNRLTSLPDGVFSGLTSLDRLYMVGNSEDPLSLPVSLVKVAGGQFKAVAPTGAPFKMVLRLVIANGSIDGGTTSVTIPQGSVESNTLTITRTPGTTAAVTVDIGASLPNLPASHQGYAIIKSTDLPLTVIDATATSPPVFNTGLNTTPEVAENAAANINIGTPLTATDADTDDTLTYRLMAHTDDADDYLSFTIDENTGQLKTKADVDLDFETQSTYEVMVETTDGIFTTTIDVTITVKDVNEAPTFPENTDTRDIAENTIAGVNIGNPVAATDPDTADGDTDVNPDDSNVDALSYSLGGTDAASFDIDTTTGQLKTKAALDYETKDDYEVTVTASDGGTDTASITVTINIIDVDDTPPTVEITSATTVQNDKFGVTFTFSEAVSGFVASDVSLTTTLTEGTGNAAIDNLTLVTGSNTQYTAEITPPTNAEGRITIQVPASAAQDAATNGNTASSEYTVSVDTIIPSTTITAPTTATGAFSVTITFSEDMTGFDNLATDIMLSGRAAATVTSLTGSGTTYTANITPTSNGNLKISVPKNAAKDKANNGNTASQSHTVSIGLTGPSVSIQGVPTDPQNSAFTITISFSELVTGFNDAATDISLGTDVSATVSSLTGSGMTYTATITPADSVEEKITLSVPAGVAQDSTSMDNTASLEFSIQLDNVQPSVAITAPTTAAEAFDVTITFSETVTGFVQSDISLTDSTATAAFTNFTTEDAKEYTATITPTTNGSVVVSVPAEVAKDVAENQNTASNMATVTVDFNDAPVFNTGLNITPTIAENTAEDTNVGTPLTATDADTEDTLTYSLKAHVDDADDYLSFAIDGNTGQLKTKENVNLDFETQSTYKVTVEVSDSVATATIDVTITITNVNEAPMFDAETATRTVPESASDNQAFGAAITATDPDAADTLTYSLEASTDAPADVNLFDIGSMTGQLKTKEGVDPNLDFEGDKTTYTLVVKVTDSGNLTDTVTVTITVTDVDEPPTVSIDAAQAVKDNPQNEKFEVTVTFSEAVNNFTASGIALTITLTQGTGNATVSLKDANDGDTVYTAEITPPANAEGEVKIQVSAGGAQDAANQDNTASSEFTVDIDTKSPTVSITDVPSTTQNNTFEVTITFSEAVVLTNSGNITTSDSVSQVYSLSGSGSTHTATLSRVDDKDGNVILKVPAGFGKDSAGNLNTESSQHTVSVDWKDPTVTVTGPSDTQTSAFDITITFSETVTDFGQGDISLTDNTATATVTDFATVSGGEYTAEITPTTSGNVKIKVPADVAQDAANNENTESNTLTVAVTINSHPNDKVDPPDAIMIASQNNIMQPDQTVTPGTFALIMDFGEPVTGFEQSELGINEFQTDVTMTGWQADADGKKYTATFNAVGTGSVTFTVPEDAVEAVDNGVGNRERKLSVFIRDDAIETNRAPVFATDTVMRTIAENTEIGTAIGAPVTATDPDNDTLRYSLEAHDDASNDYKAFNIGYNTGQLKTSKPLDHETQSIYKLTVKVSDNRRGVDTVAVTITVTDVAETQPNRAPEFAADSTTREIAERTVSNQSIGAKITATDPDGDALTYSLKAHDDGPNDYKAFSIQSTSTGGQLKTKTALDYETQSIYKVIVEVSDSRGGTDTITVTITITDITTIIGTTIITDTDEAQPNRPPVFASEGTTRAIGETNIADVKIGAPVSATDPDGDPLIYSLEGTDAASFKIVESTGQLKTKVALDRDAKHQYTVTVKVDDGNGGTDTITVTINILAPDRPEPIMFVKQNGVVKHDQMVTPGTFELVMDFAQPVTGFEKGELGIDALHTTITMTGWKVSNDKSDYIATFHAEKSGSVTFTVPENALQAADDGQTNAEWKLFVMVINNAAPTGRKGTLAPIETLLFPNYPNPFNPETWIPYHLADASEVRLTIYNAWGSVVRILRLGHQAAGRYTSRNRAAYWDGTNEFGESVASGVYFYTLIAGDFSATRRMLILK